MRVGNEDNIWDMHKKRWPTVKQVEWAVKQSEQFGRKVATADEARKIMKIGVWYDTVEETLFNLGLPPNRPEGYKGFLTYDTDGRLPKAAEARTSPPASCSGSAAAVLPRQEGSDLILHDFDDDRDGPWDDAHSRNCANGIPRWAEACARMATNPWRAACCRASSSS